MTGRGDLSTLPFSQASENNKQAILAVIRTQLARGDKVLEIGSGTGQHAVFFAREMADVVWQPSDRAEHLPGIRARIRASNQTIDNRSSLDNLREPLLFDVRDVDWAMIATRVSPDHVFTANTAHIMHWPAVCALFAGVGSLLAGGKLIQYGPFNRDGAFTSESNRQFDASLRARDPGMGIRDDAALKSLAAQSGFTLVQDFDMPANNRLLVWESAPN